MKIVQIVPSLEPRHGGPSVSVPNLARGLAGLGHDVTLFTTGPIPSELIADTALKIKAFSRRWPAALCRATGMARHLAAADAEIFHSHGLWLRPLHYASRAARRHSATHVISPRGMMNAWAWNHHRAKKILANLLVHPGALSGAHGWHATSPGEADEIRAHGFTQPLCVATNGVSAPADADRAAALAHWHEHCPDTAQRPTAIFYSRLHHKKRVLELIDLWLVHAPADWLLLIVGIPEGYTPRQLERYVMRSSGAGRVRAFDGIDRPPPYAVASLFLLPSHSENFGLAIAEAMSHGVPVLVTDTTPWTALNALDAGWCVPWTEYASALRHALREPRAQLRARGARAREWVLREFSWQQSARRLADFYLELKSPPTPLARGP